jgi:hypothetical protein
MVAKYLAKSKYKLIQLLISCAALDSAKPQRSSFSAPKNTINEQSSKKETPPLAGFLFNDQY